ncbi:MAG: UDP-N-acetylglucosamine 1-carboxyvinyltransferase [Coriobacteriia bacterium]
MKSILIEGGRRLTGEVAVEGAKNSALKLMAASLLAEGLTHLERVPEIRDVDTMCEVLRGLGASVERSDHSLSLDTTEIVSVEAPYEMVARMRASFVVLGPLVGRVGHARVAMPGGCNIGSRKIDMHLKGLSALGVEITQGHGYIDARADRLKGADVTLDFPSVGATENLLMASVKAEGVTRIENAAREPEIRDLADFLNKMGARIEGAGTPSITVEGVRSLEPVRHSVIGDRIEAGTYLVAGAMCGGPVRVTGFSPAHMERVLAKLEEAGAQLDQEPDAVTVKRDCDILPLDVSTLPYPGFPTDMQPQFVAMLSIADGDSVVTENVFENRFIFADELNRMGADVRIEGHHALVRGVERLSAAPVRCPDLRAGAALVLAGLVADGQTRVEHVHHVERGYERLVEKLAGLGARVSYASEEED